MGIAHFALNFRARNQSRDRIDHNDIDCIGTHQCIGDFQCLFTCIGLRDDQIVDIDAQLLGIARVKRMLRIDERGCPAQFLNLGNRMQRQRGFTRAFRTLNFEHAATRQSTDAKRYIKAKRPC